MKNEAGEPIVNPSPRNFAGRRSQMPPETTLSIFRMIRSAQWTAAATIGARLGIEQIVGSLQMTGHYDPGNDCEHALASFVHGFPPGGEVVPDAFGA